ncbi:MAG: ATP synthase F1 subunit gamma [Prevotellaceae bacterium]|jgi:F-type H+-transporting ATPase subunit gamma|nr:ATP synthase F1 subunit gamma [Prevotellaceae bacterium]
MASLKEIRNRIKSVSSTRKITSAMKMVSAAKLKKAQRTIENSLPYVSKVSTILNSFVASLDGGVLPAISQVREVRRVAIIAVSSNSSLCGAFNSNAIKAFTTLYNDYRKTLSAENIIVFPIGKKITEAVDKLGIAISEDNIDIGHSVEYATVDNLMTRLMQDFAEKRIDKVEIIYNHFKSAASQAVRTETLLPFAPPASTSLSQQSAGERSRTDNTDYIIEPNAAELVNELIPKVAKLQLFTALQDSVAAEHAARTMAMQIATDNADDLSQELKLSYNKMRQATITNEIITITGGAEALK